MARELPPWRTVTLTVPLALLSRLSLRATFLAAFRVTVAVPALAILPLPEATLLVPSLRAVAASAVRLPEAVQAAAQETLTLRPLAATAASLAAGIVMVTFP